MQATNCVREELSALSAIAAPSQIAASDNAGSSPARQRLVILGGLGWTVRNYLCNPGFRSFLESHDVYFWSPAYRELEREEQFHGLARFGELNMVAPSGLRDRVLYFARAYYAFRFNSHNLRSKLNKGHEARQGRGLNLLYSQTLEFGAHVASYVVPAQWVERLERWGGATGASLVNDYEKRLREIAPALVMSTCPLYNFLEWPPVIAAARLGIPLAVQIPSWDNLTSKGHLAARFEKYFVWCGVMERELIRDYAVGSEHIVQTGSPSFDFYFQPEYQENRRTFAARHGLAADRPIILYGGVTQGLMPHDDEICRIILDAIRRRRLPADTQVLVRAHPKDSGERWTKLRRSYPELSVCASNSMRGDVNKWAPNSATVMDQVSCVRHAAVHVNVASTLTLDACVVDRPVVNVAFDPVDPMLSRHVANYYLYEHYRPVVDLGAAALARNPEELIARIGEYLEDATCDAANRARLVELQLGCPDGHAGERLAQELEKLLELLPLQTRQVR